VLAVVVGDLLEPHLMLPAMGCWGAVVMYTGIVATWVQWAAKRRNT
jgi:hypothetical protein